MGLYVSKSSQDNISACFGEAASMHTTATIQSSDPGTTSKIRRCENGQDIFEVNQKILGLKKTSRN